jgi:hypothetical protein
MPIVVRAASPELLRAGALSGDASDAFKEEIAALEGQGWSSILTATVDSYASPVEAVADAVRNPYTGMRRDPSEAFDRLGLQFAEPEAEVLARIAHNPKVLVAFSRIFAGRVEEWLSRLLQESLSDLLSGTAPPSPVFLALPAPRATRDEVGLWVWERLTQTHVEQWATSSLLREWRLGRGELPLNCPPRILAERTVEIDYVSQLTLERLASQRPQPAPKRGLEAINFTKAAAQHLLRGEWREAANVFAGLVDLRPADGDAINNLGFCLLPIDRAAALDYFEKATFYRREDPTVNVANRMLALHLHGRDEEALEVARGANLKIDPSKTAFLWKHSSRSGALVLDEHVQPLDYVQEMMRHIEEGDCPA